MPSMKTFNGFEVYDEIARTMKANIPTEISYTIVVDGWNDTIYSFESVYPVEVYDLEIRPSENMTEDEFKAYGKSQMVGMTDTNGIKAYGTVPTIDLPVILRVTSKEMAQSRYSNGDKVSY